MRVIVSLSVVLALALLCAGDFVDDYAKASGLPKVAVRQCLQEAGLRPDQLQVAHNASEIDGGHRNHRHNDRAVQQVAKQVGCFYACFYRKSGGLIGTELQVERFAEVKSRLYHFEPENRAAFLKTLYHCAKTVSNKNDVCEVARGFTNCYWFAMGK